jgi:hypothetical protein
MSDASDYVRQAQEAAAKEARDQGQINPPSPRRPSD